MPAERIAVRAEELAVFRWAALLLVTEVYEESQRRHPLTLERIATYEFFSAHPFLVFSADAEVGRILVRNGLEPRSLTYAAAPDRLANRRERIRADISDLSSRALVDVTVKDGRLAIRMTLRGKDAASHLRSLQANALRESALQVIAKLDRLADRTLNQRSREWTEQNGLIIDIFQTA